MSADLDRRVAEQLGWTKVHEADQIWPPGKRLVGVPPENALTDGAHVIWEERIVPAFKASPRAMVWLMVTYRILVGWKVGRWYAEAYGYPKGAKGMVGSPPSDMRCAIGDTPQEAVATLVAKYGVPGGE